MHSVRDDGAMDAPSPVRASDVQSDEEPVIGTIARQGATRLFGLLGSRCSILTRVSGSLTDSRWTSF
jgi:hypothetical protein